MSRPWLDTETERGLLHARAGLPDRWDVSVSRDWTVARPVSRRRVAAQVRQDLWRAAQSIRGFVPRVLVRAEAGQIHLTAGGTQLTGRTPPGLTARLTALSDWPDRHESGR